MTHFHKGLTFKYLNTLGWVNFAHPNIAKTLIYKHL